MTISHLTIGTRGSQMALMQANLVAERLKARYPGLAIDIEVITTKGDTDDSPIPLDTVGKAWFTSEIEQALLNGRVDFAVHSLKDLPPEVPAELAVSSVLVRSDPRDALVTRTATRLGELTKGAVIGTDSLRRKAQLLQQRPDLVVQSIRGNANTRLQKLQDGGYDALVVAAAGMERIGRARDITEYFAPDVFVPAIGQGALAVEARKDNPELWTMLHALQDPPTQAAVDAEQAFARVIGGSCKLPLGCYVYFKADTVHIHGMAGNMEGTVVVTKTVSGPANKAIELAQRLAAELAKEPFVAQYDHDAAR